MKDGGGGNTKLFKGDAFVCRGEEEGCEEDDTGAE